MVKKKLHLIISGKVQGVFFRDSTTSKAKEFDVNGWVKNNSDGTVEALYEGEEENLKQLLEFCKKGPEMANVEKVEIKWEGI